MKSLSVAVALGIAIVVGAFLVGGSKGATGAGLAVTISTLGWLGTWGMVRSLGELAKVDAKPGCGGWFMVITAIVKLPILAMAFFYTKRLGIEAERGFIGGLLLVYSLLVGWAATRNVSKP